MKAEADLTAVEILERRVKVEPGGTNADGLKRAVGTTRVLITIYLILDFALVFRRGEFFPRMIA